MFGHLSLYETFDPHSFIPVAGSHIWSTSAGLGDLLQEVTAQILFTAIKRMRANQYFLSLHHEDQQVLLEESWSELFLLNAAYWPIDIAVLLLRWSGLIAADVS